LAGSFWMGLDWANFRWYYWWTFWALRSLNESLILLLGSHSTLKSTRVLNGILHFWRRHSCIISRKVATSHHVVDEFWFQDRFGNSIKFSSHVCNTWSWSENKILVNGGLKVEKGDFFNILAFFYWMKKSKSVFFMEVRNATEAHTALMRGAPYVPRTLQMQLKRINICRVLRRWNQFKWWK
jgi:hypothetical protein